MSTLRGESEMIPVLFFKNKCDACDNWFYDLCRVILFFIQELWLVYDKNWKLCVLFQNSLKTPLYLTKFVNANSYVSKIITQGFFEINEDNITAVATTGKMDLIKVYFTIYVIVHFRFLLRFLGCDMCFQPLLKEIIIECDVTNRFARTVLKHKFNNLNIKAQETTFSVILTENAFITEFEMIIEGKSYKSYVKEKEETKKMYNEVG